MVDIVGLNGNVVADGVTLSTEEQTFEAETPFKVAFLNDAVGSDVFMKMVSPSTEVSTAVNIEHPNFKGWNCGSSNENKRCDHVRSGIFAWNGEYTVTAKVLQTTIGTTIAMTLKPEEVGMGDTAVAKELSDRHQKLVLPMLEEDHLDDTKVVTDLLKKLEKKAAATTQAYAATDAPDSAVDACMLKENTTLQEKLNCTYEQGRLEAQKEKDCAAVGDVAVGEYTIDQSKSFGFSYKTTSSAKPQATCNFETYTLKDSSEAGCEAFVDDIIGEAKDEYDDDFALYQAASKKCYDSTELWEKQIELCVTKNATHLTQEEECVVKETVRKVMVCKLQMALKGKCTTLSHFYAAVAELAAQEELRNKELRAVSFSKCLLDTYSEGNSTCFKTSVSEHCEKMVNGASEEYATAAAEQIHKFRMDAKKFLEEFGCEASSIVIGDDKSYEKADSSDSLSYFVQKGALTFTATAAGDFSPAVCETR